MKKILLYLMYQYFFLFLSFVCVNKTENFFNVVYINKDFIFALCKNWLRPFSR